MPLSAPRVGTGYVGHFQSLAALSAKYNPLDYAGRSATVEFQLNGATAVATYTCNGQYWYQEQDPSSAAITGGSVNGVTLNGASVALRWPYRRAAINRRPIALHPAPPTITYSATAPTGVRALFPSTQNVQVLGAASVSLDSTFGFMTPSGSGQGAMGFEAEFTGDVLTYEWKCGSSTLERVMIYVDGLPCMAAAATPSVSTVNGSIYNLTLTFSTFAKRKVEGWVTNTSRLSRVYIPINGALSPTPKKPTVLLVGDSFLGGSAAITDYSLTPGSRLWQMFDANIVQSGIGGTGYVNAGTGTPFGEASRVAMAAACDPDKIIFLGSLNDDGQPGIQAAASACFAAYKAAAPNATMYAFGPQPSNATDTISANRAANIAAVSAAAAANGVTFFDMCGTASGVPAVFNSGTNYTTPQTVTYRGSVWRCSSTFNNPYASGPAASAFWDLITYDLYGTGKVGSTASDGSRDVMLYSDGVHPTELGCGPLTQRLALPFTN